MNLRSDASSVKGIGPQTAEKLAQAGIRTVEDLIYFLPRTYEDFADITTVANLQPGHVSLKATVENVVQKRVRRGLHITEAVLADETGKVRAVWFNQSYRAEQLKDKGYFFVSGTYGFQRNKYLITNPSVEKATDLPVQGGRILPVYREVRGIKSHALRKVFVSLKPLLTMLPETLPLEILKKEGLMSLSEALLSMHFPKSMEDIQKGRERLAFEELFILQLASVRNKQENAKLESWTIPFDERAAKGFVSRLPFELTDAQRRSAWEVLQNFEAGIPMNRLLQGDVGAGKTVVAGMAAYLAANAGYQTAFMAPTEILATQHATTLQKLLEPFNVTVALLVGSVKPSAKKMLKEQIARGSVALVVGTHAMIQEDVDFHKLGFVVIDEQHRFGVKQRQALLTKSDKMPHLLAMTATPIPRSLALTVYGELDVSILNQRPKGRKEIVTEIHSPNSRTQLYSKIMDELDQGRQAYVVCPAITSGGEMSEIKSVEEEYDRLIRAQFKKYRIAKLHGQMKSEEKEAVMAAFVKGEVDVLVSTTVIEVGVDVPNSTIMLIEGADRFGLAQLHQLRGRVGRGQYQSYCFLVPSTSKAPSQRLKELARSNDGFYLAEVDLKLRGPGEIYGKAQSGALDLRIASLGDTKLIKRARDAAELLLKNHEYLIQYKQLLERVEYYQRLTTLN